MPALASSGVTAALTATVLMMSAPAMAAAMFAGMIVMAFGFWFYSIAAALMRVRCIILERGRGSEWVAQLVRSGA